MCSVGILTSLPSENLNDVKDGFGQAIQDQEDHVLAASRVHNAIDAASMSTKSTRVAKKLVNRKGDGVMSFGEFAVLLRGGSTGLLPPKDAKLLKDEILKVKSGASIAELLSAVDGMKLLDESRRAFNTLDTDKDGFVSWSSLPHILRQMGKRLEVDLSSAITNIGSQPPTAAQEELDFEEW